MADNDDVAQPITDANNLETDASPLNRKSRKAVTNDKLEKENSSKAESFEKENSSKAESFEKENSSKAGSFEKESSSKAESFEKESSSKAESQLDKSEIKKSPPESGKVIKEEPFAEIKPVTSSGNKFDEKRRFSTPCASLTLPPSQEVPGKCSFCALCCKLCCSCCSVKKDFPME